MKDNCDLHIPGEEQPVSPTPHFSLMRKRWLWGAYWEHMQPNKNSYHLCAHYMPALG